MNWRQHKGSVFLTVRKTAAVTAAGHKDIICSTMCCVVYDCQERLARTMSGLERTVGQDEP